MLSLVLDLRKIQGIYAYVDFIDFWTIRRWDITTDLLLPKLYL